MLSKICFSSVKDTKEHFPLVSRTAKKRSFNYLPDVMLCYQVAIAKFRKAVILPLMLLLSFTGQAEGLRIKS